MNFISDTVRASAGASFGGLSTITLFLGLLLASCSSAPDPATTGRGAWTVPATVETEPALADPDDPAIWVNNADASASLVLATDKGHGLLVYDLTGKMRANLPSGKLNNVDIRQGIRFSGDGRAYDLAFASNRTDTSITWYKIAGDGTVTEGAERFRLGHVVGASPEIYGICAYVSPVDGTLYVFANFKNGVIMQFAVTGRIEAGDLMLEFAEKRRLKVTSQPEGMVADDTLGNLFVGEEDRGIWHFSAEPGSGDQARLIDEVGSAQLGNDDVEGMAIYATGERSGYLVVSSQGTHSYALYTRDGTQEPAGSFRIVTAGGIDNVSETDGLEVTPIPLGPRFPQGILVVQDDKNEGFTKNFKIVSWKDLSDAMNR